MIARDTPVSRLLAGVVIGGAMLCLFLICFAADLASHWEFTTSLTAQTYEHPPAFTHFYRQLCPYSWLVFTPALLIAAWLMRKPHCNLLAIIVYVTFLLNLAVFWMLVTILAFYLHNQTFRC